MGASATDAEATKQVKKGVLIMKFIVFYQTPYINIKREVIAKSPRQAIATIKAECPQAIIVSVVDENYNLLIKY